MRGSEWAALIAASMAVACGGSDESGAIQTGGAGEPCEGDGICDDGLTCQSDGICRSDDPCEAIDCSGRGACRVVDDAAECVCEAGHVASGTECVEDGGGGGGSGGADGGTGDPCAGIDCSGNGTCSADTGVAVCQCDSGYRAEGMSCVAETTTCDLDAVDDSVQVEEDAPSSIGVFDNDSSSAEMSVSSVTTPSNGSATTDGTDVIYTPDPDFFGDDQLEYTVLDDAGCTATATITVTVTNVNDSPTAVDDTATVASNASVLIDVLANDTFDPDPAESIWVSSVSSPSDGTASVDSTSGGITYVPFTDFVGTDSFTYDLLDENGGSAQATVTVTVADGVPPEPILDLAVSYSGVADTVELRWTATGDDGSDGTAASYIIKVSDQPLDASSFDAATTVAQSIVPQESSNVETHQVPLAWYSGTQHLAIKAVDDEGLASDISNVVIADMDLTAVFPATSADFPDLVFNDGLGRVDLQLRNDSPLVDLVMSSIAVTGDAAFTGGRNVVTLRPGELLDVSAGFEPTRVGDHSGALEIDHNDPANTDPFIVALTGKGINARSEVRRPRMQSTPATPGVTATVFADVFDANNDLPGYADVASVSLDLSAIGGPSSVAMTLDSNLDADTDTYSASVSTTGLTTGVYALPVEVTDVGGFVVRRPISLLVHSGTEHHVGSGQTHATIQAAIDAANDDDAVIVHDGTYTGVGNKNLIVGGKRIIVTSQNGPESAIIDCEQAGRGFDFNGSSETPATVISGLTIDDCGASAIRMVTDASPTITNMIFSDNNDSTAGGALFMDGASVAPTIIGSTFTGNWSPGESGAVYGTNGANAAFIGTQFLDNGNATATAWGGAALFDGATASFTDTLFDANVAYFGGGALNVRGGATVTVTNSVFTRNWIFDNGGSWTDDGGGAINQQSGTLAIVNSAFERNDNARGNAEGGAIFSKVGMTVTNSTFIGNTSSGSGGAIVGGGFEVVDSYFSGNLARNTRWGGAIHVDTPQTTIRGSIFEGNTAFRGGGISIDSFGLWLSNNLIVANVATEGGGMYIQDGTALWPVSVWSTTVSANSADTGGGIYFAGGESTLLDSIVWGNTAATTAGDVWVENLSSVVVTTDFSLLGTSGTLLVDPGLRINAGGGFVPGSGGNLSTDPLFVTGSLGDYLLSQTASGQSMTSPAVDAGSDLAIGRGLDGRTTRTDSVTDTGTVDIGFHYRP